ncbi:FkbM family methyltransferase [Belnapia sp. F-4-1]|uniref:FkbM family methyltransferase n=1 Tax=Belnapia sp. F-4-1 TaxID=1545443 RepID=UPI00068CAB0A|nr:FkbM family methyltransferase [Belnapia sp. F-4-1]
MTTAATFLSYSANNEDVILNRVFGGQAHGFFVDVGAAHPLYENDTRALYDRGWRGINIEPTAAFFHELVAQRPRDINLNVAVSDAPGELVFHEVVGTGLSTGNADDASRAAAAGFEVVRHTVPARTLRDILQEAAPPDIDVLKVDVEGFELKVMQSNDWDRFRPRVILAEGTFPASPMRRQDGVADYLAAQGYRHVYFDGLNDFYVERNFAPPPEAFDRPPNVFDRYVPYSQHDLVRARAALEAQVEDLQLERENAGRRIASLDDELTRRDAAHAALSAQLHRAEVAAEAQGVDLHHARSELAAMRSRCEALSAELDGVTMQLMLAQARPALQMTETDRIARELHNVYASTSWRITRPMRALARPRRSLGILFGRS